MYEKSRKHKSNRDEIKKLHPKFTDEMIIELNIDSLNSIEKYIIKLFQIYLYTATAVFVAFKIAPGPGYKFFVALFGLVATSIILSVILQMRLKTVALLKLLRIQSEDVIDKLLFFKEGIMNSWPSRLKIVLVASNGLFWLILLGLTLTGNIPSGLE